MFVRICDFNKNLHQLHDVIEIDRVYVNGSILDNGGFRYRFIQPNATYEVRVSDVEKLEIYDNSSHFFHKTQSPISLF